MSLRVLWSPLGCKGKALQQKCFFALRASCLPLGFTKKQRQFVLCVSRFVLALKLHKECVFFLSLRAMCERLRQRLCLRFLGELEIENKLKKSNATPIVLAHRVHTNNIFFCFFALSVALAFDFDMKNNGKKNSALHFLCARVSCRYLER